MAKKGSIWSFYTWLKNLSGVIKTCNLFADWLSVCFTLSEFAFRPFCEIPVSWGHCSIVITAGTVQSSCTLLDLTFSCDLSSEKKIYSTYCVFVFLLLLWRWGRPPALFRPACAGLLYLGRCTMCAWPQDRAAGFLGSVWWQTMVTLSSSLNTGKRYEKNKYVFFLYCIKGWILFWHSHAILPKGCSGLSPVQ